MNITSMQDSSDNSPATGLIQCDNTMMWDEFCYASPEGTPFMQSWFIQATSDSADRYFWQENGKALAAVLIPLENGAPSQPKFSVHHSICFSGELNKLSNAKKSRKCYEILDSIVDQITKKYKQVYLFLHPNIIDVRPLLWHNYHNPENGAFKVDVRYTAVRSLLDINSIDDLLLDIRKDRRADYKRSLKENIKISSQPDLVEFLQLYRKTFDRQNIEIDNDTLSIVENVLKGISEQRGFVLIARTKEKTPVSATAILTDKRTAYSLFTVNNPDYRQLGANSAIVMEALLYAKSIGKSEFDFVGANSPNRGDFKLSFNAQLKCYFECKKTSH